MSSAMIRSYFEFNFFFRGSTAVVGLGLLYKVICLYSDTPHSVGLLWMSDQPYAETST